MFAFIAHKLGNLFAQDKAHQHDAYLASSTDLAELERRMRSIDQEEHAYSMRFCGAITTDRSTAVSNF